MLVGICGGSAALGIQAGGPYGGSLLVASCEMSDRIRWGSRGSAVAPYVLDAGKVDCRRLPTRANNLVTDRRDASAAKTPFVVGELVPASQVLAPRLPRTRFRRQSAIPANKPPNTGGERP
jgi:hypothetical protein